MALKFSPCSPCCLTVNLSTYCSIPLSNDFVSISGVGVFASGISDASGTITFKGLPQGKHLFITVLDAHLGTFRGGFVTQAGGTQNTSVSFIDSDKYICCSYCNIPKSGMNVQTYHYSGASPPVPGYNGTNSLRFMYTTGFSPSFGVGYPALVSDYYVSTGPTVAGDFTYQVWTQHVLLCQDGIPTLYRTNYTQCLSGTCGLITMSPPSGYITDQFNWEGSMVPGQAGAIGNFSYLNIGETVPDLSTPCNSGICTTLVSTCDPFHFYFVVGYDLANFGGATPYFLYDLDYYLGYQS